MKIIRIVRMSFHPHHIPDFLSMFSHKYPYIRHFEGCSYLRLLKDDQLPYVYYTLSEWESAEHLEAYRKSELFKETWKLTRTWFNDKPQAFSLLDAGQATNG